MQIAKLSMQACIGNIKIDWKQKVHWKQSYELGFTEISPRFPKILCPGPFRGLKI